MKKRFLTVLFLISLLSGIMCFAAEVKSESSEVFIKKLRSSHPVGTWGILTGDIAHKRRKIDNKNKGLFSNDYKTEYAEIKVGTLFTSLQVVAMIKLTDEDNSSRPEIYKVGQEYNGDPATVIVSNLKEQSLIGKFGVSPGDFTMAFLYWDINKDASQDMTENVKGLKCRIINLINSKTKEKVKVYASIDYYYPLKVQWFRPRESEVYRTMVIDSFKHDGELGAPSQILITGPGWKTKIDFNSIKLGYSKDGNPKNLFQ